MMTSIGPVFKMSDTWPQLTRNERLSGHRNTSTCSAVLLKPSHVMTSVQMKQRVLAEKRVLVRVSVQTANVCVPLAQYRMLWICLSNSFYHNRVGVADIHCL